MMQVVLALSLKVVLKPGWNSLTLKSHQEYAVSTSPAEM